MCSRLKHVFNIRGSSFNSLLINSLFTVCRKSGVIIMRRVVRERPASSTALISIVFGFFAMGSMMKFEARQAFQSSRLIVSFPFSSFSFDETRERVILAVIPLCNV